MVGKLILIIGCMFAGKTSTLISLARKYIVAKRNVALIRYKGDDRYSVNDIVSHNKDCVPSTYATDDLSGVVCQDSDVIIIDEIQFFKNVLTFVKDMTEKGKIVICAGLNGDFNRKLFPVIGDLIPEADDIIHMKSICEVCHEETAVFSKLIVKPNNDSNIIIGGSEMYQARCRTCFD